MADASTPDQASPDQFKLWTARIKKARKTRKDWEKKYKVEKCEKFYLGDQWDGDPNARVMNRYAANIKVTMPNLLFDNPKVIVRPRPGHEQDARRKAAIGENTLQSIMAQDDNFAEAAQLGLLQSFWRIGVLKVVYDPRLEPNPNFKGAGTPMMQYDKDGNSVLDDNMQSQPQVDPNTGQPIMEPEFIVSDETYRFEWVPAGDMLLPDSGPYMKKWAWIGQEVTVPLGEAKADDRFPQELRDQFTSNVKSEKGDKVKSRSKGSEDEENDDDKLFQYNELYDIRKKRWLCIAENQDFDTPLIDDVLPDGVEDHPYAILPGYLPITGPDPSPWPVPYTYSWLDPQQEYNIRRSQGMEGAKRSARKIYYDDGTFATPDEAIKGLQSSRDMEAIKLIDSSRPPTTLPDPGLPPNINQDLAFILDDYRTVSGNPGAKMGTPDADTATEAALVQRASDLRDSDMQKTVQKWLKSALKKMFQLVRKTLTVSMFVKIRGMKDQEVQQFLMSTYGIPPELVQNPAFAQMVPALMNHVVQTYGQEKVEPISREDLDFEADIDVLPGSTKPRSLTSERAQFLEVLQIIAKAPQLLISRLLLEELFSKYEFINPALIDELQMLAQQMMGAVNATAGREQGGAGSTPENTQGHGPGVLASAKSQIAQMAA